MMRSAFLALAAAAILVVAWGWQNLTSPGWGQLPAAWNRWSIDWDKLAKYYDQETVRFTGVISDDEQIAPLIPKMVDAGIGLSGPSYAQTQTERARLTVENRECISPKANLDKTLVLLRSTLSEPLDPIVASYDRTAQLSPELKLFFQEYGYGVHNLTTNALAERVTVPQVEQPRKVVVAGGSAAFGLLLGDANSLASRLQKRDSSRQYITLAVPEGSAEQVICNLTKAVSRYRGEVDELIYFYSEADLDSGERLGTPEEAIGALKNLAQNEAIGKVTVFYSPLIYSLAPQYTRYRGYASDLLPNRREVKERLRKIVAGAGFGWLDIGEVALAASKAQGSEFSVLNNFADDRNLSREGMDRLVERLMGPEPKPVAPAPVTAAPKAETVAAKVDPEVEKRAEKLEEALEDIRKASGHAAKNNRLRRDVDKIMQKLKKDLAEGD
ncbi:MAG: hypothetical protein AB7S92_14975 [Parvibaculaceae bacterium]